MGSFPRAEKLFSSLVLCNHVISTRDTIHSDERCIPAAKDKDHQSETNIDIAASFRHLSFLNT